MVLVYNIIWIILVLLLFLAFLTFLKRRSTRKNAQPQVTQITPTAGYPHATVIDMNTPSTNQPFTYRPPDDSTIEPPPPAYKDHSKDYRVQG